MALRLLLYCQYPIVNQAGLLLELPNLRLASLLLVCAGVALAGWHGRSARLVVASGMAVGGLLLMDWLDLTEWLYVGLPLIVPATLLIAFASTLRAGQEPLVTAVGERARGPLSPAMRRYTRAVTWLWVAVLGLLMAAALASLALQFAARMPHDWTMWILNIAGPGLVVAVFVGEFVVRKRLFPEHAHPGFAEYLAIVRRGR